MQGEREILGWASIVVCMKNPQGEHYGGRKGRNVPYRFAHELRECEQQVIIRDQPLLDVVAMDVV